MRPSASILVLGKHRGNVVFQEKSAATCEGHKKHLGVLSYNKGYWPRTVQDTLIDCPGK